MKTCVLLPVLLVLGCVHGAPVEQSSLQQGSCEDASAKGAAKLALTKINHDRKEGYSFDLLRLSNVHMKTHGEAGVVFYLTLDVVETNCSVLIRDDSRTCVPRPVQDTPVYGQCKAAIYISKVHRVVRLYKYNCIVRPVPAAKVAEQCPDCPTLIAKDDEMVQKTVSLALQKFNKENKLTNIFSLLQVNRATAGMAMMMYYNVEFVIQETTCTKSTEGVELDKCPRMECEFAHKGFCTASLYQQPGDKTDLSVNCELIEPEAADREKKLHLLADGTDHAHNDTHAHDPEHDKAHAADPSHTHDHIHDHTKSHSHHDHTHQHADGSDHHHTHNHKHAHDHGHGHDHVHAHHAKAHDHSADFPNQHHNYKHAEGTHTHEHDHEIALDHDHKHAHLHEHEHHHHHHEHTHETAAHDHPEGRVTVVAAMDQPMILPSFPDVPAAGPEVGVTLPLKPDPQIPGVTEPIIENLPATLSAQCPTPVPGDNLVEKVFAEDPMFKPAA